MLKMLAPARIIITRFNNPRSFEPQELAEKCGLENFLIADDIKKALVLAEKLYTEEHVIVVSGSVFLISEARQYLGDRSKAYSRTGTTPLLSGGIFEEAVAVAGG